MEPFSSAELTALAHRVRGGRQISGPFGTNADVPASTADTEHLGNNARVGSWLIEGELGRGGMSTVYLARHATTGKRAAVKVLRDEFAREPRLAQSFVNEARALALVQHPNIARAYQFSRMEDGRPCIVMEYLGCTTTIPLSTPPRALPCIYAE
jgi:serine/threonine protein kinase